MKNKQLNVLTYGYSPWQYPANWFKNIKQFFRNLEYVQQRATRGFCDRDIWNLDNYYSELFYQTLNYLADNAHGYPGTGDFSGDNGYENWQNYLKEMAEHFLNTQEYNENVPCNRECMLLYRQYQKTKLDADKDAWFAYEQYCADFREKEKDIAFDMMKKYFFDLWD